LWTDWGEISRVNSYRFSLEMITFYAQNFQLKGQNLDLAVDDIGTITCVD